MLGHDYDWQEWGGPADTSREGSDGPDTQHTQILLCTSSISSLTEVEGDGNVAHARDDARDGSLIVLY